MGYVAPGDIIILHGIVGGSRGVCLVVSVKVPDKIDKSWWNRRYLTVFTRGCRLVDIDVLLDEENNSWSRINDR